MLGGSVCILMECNLLRFMKGQTQLIYAKMSLTLKEQI